MTHILNWINGWRVDMDGWLVRARREADPDALPDAIGFVTECAVAVRTPADARALDKGRIAAPALDGWTAL